MIGYYLWNKAYKQEQSKGFMHYKEYVQTRAVDAKEKLITSFLPLVKSFLIDLNIMIYEEDEVSEDDLQEGALIVAEEVNKYDFNRPMNFASYKLLEHKIANEMFKKFIDARNDEIELISLNDPSLYNTPSR